MIFRDDKTRYNDVFIKVIRMLEILNSTLHSYNIFYTT